MNNSHKPFKTNENISPYNCKGITLHPTIYYVSK